jgi:ADP-ribose pyrophosphatase
MSGGYGRRSRRTVYENPWVRFEAHEIVHPNGKDGEHGVVVTPVASAVIALDGGDIIFARQPRYAIDRFVIEAVKGGAAAGESPLACAQRELAEEVGMIAQRWDALGIAYEIPSIVREPVHVFLARELRQTAAAPEEFETIEAVKMPLVRALDAVATGEISDAVTALALWRALRLLEGEE